jgi:peroxidase
MKVYVVVKSSATLAIVANAMLIASVVLVVTANTIPDFDVRSFDGTDRQDKSGRAPSPLIRWVPASQVDINDENLPNPRRITNAVVRQPEEFPLNNRHLTDMVWQWGQFIDHDFALTTQKGGMRADVMVPMENENDVLVQANCSVISFIRTDIDPNLPTREQVNTLTAFLDASMVYGSDKNRADALRTFVDGKLKVR